MKQSSYKEKMVKKFVLMTSSESDYPEEYKWTDSLFCKFEWILYKNIGKSDTLLHGFTLSGFKTLLFYPGSITLFIYECL